MEPKSSFPLIMLIIIGLAYALPDTPEPAQYIQGRTYDPTEQLSAQKGSGAVYYVDAKNGNDRNDGTTIGKAFKTISKAADLPLKPGDTVLIRSGLYRGTPDIWRSGTKDATITFGAYGDGEVILDFTKELAWSQAKDDIFVTSPGHRPAAVIVDNKLLFPEFSRGAMEEGTYYYDTATKDLYVWAPGGGSPAGHDIGVVSDDESQRCLNIKADYITIYGITARFCGGHGISVLGDHVRIEKTKAIFNGKSGINVFTDKDKMSTGAEIVKNFAYQNVLQNWPRGKIKSGGWPGAIASQLAPRTLFEGNIVEDNGGEGILSYSGDGGSVIKDNIVKDAWSVGIYTDNQPGAKIENNYVICEPDYSQLHNNHDPDPGDGRNIRRLRAAGIVTADEDYGNGATLRDVLISNNVIVNCRGITHSAQAKGSGLKNVHILHNTIIVPKVVHPDEDIISGIAVSYNDGNNAGSLIADNLIYATNHKTYLVDGDSDQSGSFDGVRFDHNLWYHSTRAEPFHWGPNHADIYDHTFAEWQRLVSSDSYGDPMLIDPYSPDYLDKQPQAGSVAIDAGTNTGISTDFLYRRRPSGTGYDAGAFEYTGKVCSLGDYNCDGCVSVLELSRYTLSWLTGKATGSELAKAISAWKAGC
jgi:hypothetical protein